MEDRAQLLINILLDKSAREDERDDAASYLGEYDDDLAMKALIEVGSNRSENDTLLDTCGESIGMIMVKRNEVQEDVLAQLSNISRKTAKAFISHHLT